jgi:hypothetical protein
MLLLILFPLVILASPLKIKPTLLLSSIFAQEASSFVTPRRSRLPHTPRTTITAVTYTSLQAKSVWSSSVTSWEDTIEGFMSSMKDTVRFLGYQSDPLSWMVKDDSKEYVDGMDDTTLLATWLLRFEKYLTLSVLLDKREKKLLNFYVQGGEDVEFGEWKQDVIAQVLIKSFLFEVVVMADLLVAASYREEEKKSNGIPEEWYNLSDEQVMRIYFKAEMLKRNIIL